MSGPPPVFVPPPRRTPLRIDALPFEWPTLLAPMEGVTNAVFRGFIADRGPVGALCTEFVRVTDKRLSNKVVRREVVRVPGVPLSVQVMGNEPHHMRDAAEAMAAAGADVVDINLGCPAPRVVRKGVGSAMLKDPALLHEVLTSMRAVVPGLLSAKIRAGFDEADHVVAIARTVESAGADFIAVHPRRRSDFYRGVADWRIIRTLKSALDIPVIGNGDVWYADDALRMIEETGCDAVMIGRPALRNPWIFRQISERIRGVEPFRPSGADVVEAFDALIERYLASRTGGKRGPVGRIKEWITFLGRAVLDEGAWRHDALRLTELDEIRALTRARLAHLGPDALDLGPSNDRGIETSGSAVQSPMESE